jgi:ATP-dependent protease Clp ATPase subunit
MISTENILFILGGSFERTHDNLESIVKKRLQHKGRVREDGSVEIIGFAVDEKKNEEAKLMTNSDGLGVAAVFSPQISHSRSGLTERPYP